MMIDEWAGCYPSQWKGIIVPDAIAHPAKFSSKLIRRIYDHIAAEGWVHPGDTIIDPFGGVALGALDALRHGLDWRGVELEPRFADLGNANIDLWNNRFSRMPGWGDSAHLFNGDSRELAKVLGFANASVSSPPYAETEVTGERNFNTDNPAGKLRRKNKGYSGVVSSPPYADGCAHTGGDALQPLPGTGGKNELVYYGATPGQLGAMKANGFEAAVSSPPFECQSGGTNVTAKTGPLADKRLLERHAAGNAAAGYGETEGNMGSQQGDDFWTAARQIVDQVYQALVPGGHACWVVKSFVKNKERVDFPGQWRQMCEAAGFVTLHEHHALLVHSTEHDFDGKEKRRESKSFFRRLAENKGSPRIDFEVVFCMEKPL